MSLLVPIKPLILVGCSGSGRSALIYHLHTRLAHKFQRLISHTTRKPRPSEVNHQHFHFETETWVLANKEKFVTLTYSGNHNYYGITSDEIAKVVANNRIPVFKMTLDAYVSNVLVGSAGEERRTSRHLYLMRDKKIECNALYIRIPSMKELERRLRFTPLSPQEQKEKLDKAKKEHEQAGQYFEAEDMIGREAKAGDDQEEDLSEMIMRVQSRLFQLY